MLAARGELVDALTRLVEGFEREAAAKDVLIAVLESGIVLRQRIVDAQAETISSLSAQTAEFSPAVSW